MWLKEIIVESWESLARNRLRSVLTMLGITWGLVTVVLLLGYGQGVGDSVLNAFLGIGNNVIMIWGRPDQHAGRRRARRTAHSLQVRRHPGDSRRGAAAQRA